MPFNVISLIPSFVKFLIHFLKKTDKGLYYQDLWIYKALFYLQKDGYYHHFNVNLKLCF